jgi:hypothetical protein
MFKIYCDNKGCGKDMEPLLNVETNDVECTECGRTINCVSKFTKTQMKVLGQIKRDQKAKQAYSVQCRFCSKESPPALDENDNICCSLCNKTLDYLAAPYVHAVKQLLLSRRQKKS